MEHDANNRGERQAASPRKSTPMTSANSKGESSAHSYPSNGIVRVPFHV